jgi:molecular chaperone DnaK
MGRRYSEVQEEIKLVPCEVARGPNDLAVVKAGGKTYTLPELSAMILRKLKLAAEAYLGRRAGKTVVTVPAYFNDARSGGNGHDGRGGQGKEDVIDAEFEVKK